jgi:hypothetical protein
MSEGASPLKASGTMAEPGLVHSPADTLRFVSAAIFGRMVVVLHPPYLPNLASCDFLLFLRIRLQLKGYLFPDVFEIEELLLTVLHAIPKCQF